MKVIVFSDSHGCAGNMLAALELEKPDCCIFLGDGELDLQALRRRAPELPIHALRGNCDRYSSLPTKRKLLLEGVRIYAVHGHEHGVKLDSRLDALRYEAMAEDADVLLFGHTHVPYEDYSLCMHILNPGMIGDVPAPSYGLLELNAGRVRTQIKTLSKAAPGG